MNRPLSTLFPEDYISLITSPPVLISISHFPLLNNIRTPKTFSSLSAALHRTFRFPIIQTGIEISCIPRDLIIVIFYYQISLKPLKTLSLAQVSFPLLFPLCYIVPPVFTNSDKGKYKGKKTDNTL